MGGISKEHLDTRVVEGDYYLSREEVDKWSKESIQGIVHADVDEENPCAEQWKNLNEAVTSKMWGIYNETAVFLALCRHSFVLLITNMVQSGELAKYPLAILKKLLDVIGGGIGMGYSIGCSFGTTINKSPLGSKAQSLRFASLVGAFHGHAHWCLCQTSHLATYTKGLGLEHLEQCESFFSESNELTSSTQYMSVFHRRQAISQYCYHHDNFEAYSQLSKFLVDNYKQALEIRATNHALAKTMNDLGIASTDVFHNWLKEEREYLGGLEEEPKSETLQMDYYQKLVKLDESEVRLNAATREWISYDPNNISEAFGAQDQTRRHAIKNRDDLKSEVQALETHLGIRHRWTTGSEEWEKAKKMVTMAKYQRALNKLESLVVARLFELTKLNMSRTGYKLRKHIADALKARSQAIRTAVTTYNIAASELNRPKLSWDQTSVVSRGLSLLHVLPLTSTTTLSMPTKRSKLKVKEHQQSDPLLAIQIQKFGWERGRCNDLHLMRLKKLGKMPGFSGTLLPGRGVLYTAIEVAMAIDASTNNVNDRDDDEDALPVDEDPDDEDEVLSELTAVMHISMDAT
ncbi:hypothetical protein EV368DRAFT_88232 [Lentinula lateritia]|uniref:Uncharacterized protein n=1 Tax=Lentinula aff. lateritia TaxID=2804960 RepID=A0ACC1TLE1_9AGAR|nr:hypothetical protein F5876DRAFT_82054 [Lentinula aff. lateritia]KAJ3847009.1 hypothetical protein EV368DRAFT_88232 [Lentinula lateritia]